MIIAPCHWWLEPIYNFVAHKLHRGRFAVWVLFGRKLQATGFVTEIALPIKWVRPQGSYILFLSFPIRMMVVVLVFSLAWQFEVLGHEKEKEKEKI